MPFDVGLWGGVVAFIVVCTVGAAALTRQLPLGGSLILKLFNPFDLSLGNFFLLLVLTALAKALHLTEFEKILRMISVVYLFCAFGGWVIRRGLDPQTFLGAFILTVVAWVALDQFSDALAAWGQGLVQHAICDVLPWNIGYKFTTGYCTPPLSGK